MSHFDITGRATGLADALRTQRALRTLTVVLIPVAIWTLAALIWMWPGDIGPHIRQDNTTVAIPGLTTPKGTISAVNEVSCDGVTGSATGDRSRCARLSVRLDEGPEAGQSEDVVLTAAVYASGVSEGQQVKLFRTPVDGGPAAYQFADFVRTTPLLFFALLFAAVVIAVARWRGAIAMVGLVFAGWVLLTFMFPALIEGQSPILVGLVGSTTIMFVCLYAAHGISARTTTALAGTLAGLFVAAGLGWVATKWAHLTGVASEDDFVLAASAPDLKLTSVVICGVIVAGLGVLNDVTVTQASAVWELDGPDETPRTLYRKAMRIGRDHIASSVYTIAFAAAGATLSVLLLISVYQRPVLQTLVSEQFAGEVIRTLVASIGLVLSVPLTTAIAVAVLRGSSRAKDPDALGRHTAFHPDDSLVDVGPDMQ